MSMRAGQHAHEGTPETAPSGLAGVGQAPEIFVSPRVVDRRAFSEMAGELRELIQQAGAERAALVAGLDQAGRATDDFRSREAAQAMNIELCARALKRVEEKLARAEALLAQAADAGKIVEQIDARTGNIVQSKVEALEARVQAIQSAATAHAEALEERLKRATRELEQRIEAVRRDAEAIVAPPTQALTALCGRAAQILGREPGTVGPIAEGSLGDVLARAQALSMQTTETCERLDRARTISEEHRAAFESWVSGVQSRLAELEDKHRTVGTAAHTLSELVGRALGELDVRITGQRVAAAEIGSIVDRETARAHEQTSAAVETMRSSLESVRREREAALMELKPQADGVIGQIKDAVKQAQDMHNTTGLALRLLEKASGQASGVLAQLKPWEGLLAGDAGSSVPAPIQRMIDTVRGGMQSELSEIARALRSAAASAERSAGQVGAISTHAEQPAASPVVVRRFTEQVQSAD